MQNYSKSIRKIAIFTLILTGIVFLIRNQDRLITTQEDSKNNGTSIPVPAIYPGLEEKTTVENVILQKLSACAFDGDSILPDGKVTILTSPQYVPANPRVVVAADFVLENIQWLPSGKQLLVTYTTSERAGRETIAIVDIASASISVIGERQFNHAAPIWLDNQQSIAYIDPNEAGSYNILIKRSIDGNEENLIAQTSQPYLSTGPQESLIFFSLNEKNQIEIIDTAGTIQAIFNTADPEWDFGLPLPQPGRFAWNNNASSLVINSPKGLFFLETKSGQICQFDISKQSEEKLWPYAASWSPNYRYLALLTTSGTGTLPFLNLTILDYLTGQLISVPPEELNSTGNIYFSDLAWSPDSQTIATLVGKGENTGNQLLFVDAATGNSIQVLPDTNFYSGGISGNLAWSPDGAHLAYICPKGPLCIVDINR